MEANHKPTHNANGLESPGDATPTTAKEKETYIVFDTDNPFLDPQPKGDASSDDFNDEEEDEERMKNSSCLGRAVVRFQQGTRKLIVFVNEKFQGWFFSGVCTLLYFAYFAYAMYYRFGDEGSIRLVWCTSLGIVIVCRHKVIQLLKRTGPVRKWNGPKSPDTERRIRYVRIFFRWLMNAGVGAFMIYVIVDVGMKTPRKLTSLPGIAIFLLLCFLFSSNPSRVNWHTIYWSVGLQFVLAVLVMRWQGGKEVVLWIQTRLDWFFANAKPASILLFGETYTDHYLVFGALPIIFLTNATLSMLYHLGAMQLVVQAIGSILRFFMGTSVIESTGVAASIFMEGASALLSIRPFLPGLSKSELFALTTAALSSIGGAYLALLAQIGVSVEFMLPAMVISAPANFAVCKLVVPETRKPRKINIKGVELPPEMRHSTILEAAQAGALSVVTMLVNVMVSAFVFFALITWVNITLTWFGLRVGVQQLTMEKILSYVFYPISFLMGIDPQDCRNVAMLMGLRLSAASLVSMLKLMQLVDNRDRFDQYSLLPNATVTYVGDHIVLDRWNVTLVDGFISKRSEAIAIYALCGFSGILSLFITLSIMDSLVPKRHNWLSKRGFPLLITGNLANFMVGCFAGLLVDFE